MNRFLYCLCTLVLAASVWAEEVPAPSPHLRRLDLEIPGLLIDLRYNTDNNFTGRRIYNRGEAWLRPEAITALRGVQEELLRSGHQLVILDAYRPPWAQEKLWQAFPNAQFVAPPRQGSRHSRGTTVDVTLADARGKLLNMPTEFDSFVPAASHHYTHLPAAVLRRRSLLRTAMFRHGFNGVPDEWWHYDLRTWRQFPLLVDQRPAPEG